MLIVLTSRHFKVTGICRWSKLNLFVKTSCYLMSTTLGVLQGLLDSSYTKVKQTAKAFKASKIVWVYSWCVGLPQRSMQKPLLSNRNQLKFYNAYNTCVRPCTLTPIDQHEVEKSWTKRVKQYETQNFVFDQQLRMIWRKLDCIHFSALRGQLISSRNSMIQLRRFLYWWRHLYSKLQRYTIVWIKLKLNTA